MLIDRGIACDEGAEFTFPSAVLPALCPPRPALSCFGGSSLFIGERMAVYHGVSTAKFKIDAFLFNHSPKLLHFVWSELAMPNWYNRP